MDEEFLQTYVNKLATKVNELQQENILLKSQLEFANLKLTRLETVENKETEEKVLVQPKKVEEKTPKVSPPSQFKKQPANFSAGEISGND